MATWIVHCRVGDYFLDRVAGLDKRLFSIGNVSPDCGRGKKDSLGEFTPPPRVTHWSDRDGKSHINAERFYKAYLAGHTIAEPDYSFYLGYYVHLATDIRWTWDIMLPSKAKYSREFERDPAFIRVLKHDWYDLDYKFLRDCGTPRTYEYISAAGEIHDYLDYYESGQLSEQVKYIADFYGSTKPYGDLDREYVYLTEKRMNRFVAKAQTEIEKILKYKNIL